MKKIVLSILLCVTVVFIAAGGGQEESDAGKDVEISIWQHSYPPLNDWTKEHIGKFMEQNPNVTVEYTLIPFEEWNQKIFTTLAAGQGPHFFESDDYTFAQFIANDQLAELDVSLFGYDSLTDMKADFIGSALDLVSFDDKLYGLPYDFEAPVIGYNIALFEEAGINPSSIKTWEDALNAAEKIAKRDASGNLVRSGLSMVHNIDVYYQLQGTTLFEQAGVEILNEDNTRCTINTPKAYKVFEFWRDLIHVKKADDPGFTASFYTEEFGQGRVGMGFMLVWANSILAPHDYLKGRDFDIMPIPTFDGRPAKSRSYAWNWVLNKTNSDAETTAATQLMAYLSEQGDSYLVQAGLINPRKGWEERAPKEELAKYAEIIDSLNNSIPVQPYVKYNEVWAPIIRVFKTCAVDPNADIPALLATCEKEINEIINE